MRNYLLLVSKYRGALMGIAILWVMMFHFPLKPNIPIVYNIISIGYGGVDIFLFLSGLGLYFSLSKGDIGLSQYYKKRFYRILPEFWFFLFITYIISFDFNFQSFCNLIYRATTIGYWIPHTPYNLWYISCILLLYSIFPFYFRLFNKYGLKIPMITITISLITIAIYAFLAVFYFKNCTNFDDNSLIFTIARIPIFFIGSVFGYYIKNSIKIQITYKKIAIILFAFIISIGALEYFLHFHKAYLLTCALYFLPFIIITPILCVIIAVIIDKLPQLISELFSKIGALSLELYIVHEYLYRELIPGFTAKWGGAITALVVIILVFTSAIILYYINKYFLQKSFRKILH